MGRCEHTFVPCALCWERKPVGVNIPVDPPRFSRTAGLGGKGIKRIHTNSIAGNVFLFTLHSLANSACHARLSPDRTGSSTRSTPLAHAGGGTRCVSKKSKVPPPARSQGSLPSLPLRPGRRLARLAGSRAGRVMDRLSATASVAEVAWLGRGGVRRTERQREREAKTVKNAEKKRK